MYDEEIKFKTLVTEFENGAEQRRSKWGAPLRKFTLSYTNRLAFELAQVRDLFLLKLGAASEFTWTNPNDNVEYSVRFQEDSFKFSNKAYGVYDFDVSLVQAR